MRYPRRAGPARGPAPGLHDRFRVDRRRGGRGGAAGPVSGRRGSTRLARPGRHRDQPGQGVPERGGGGPLRCRCAAGRRRRGPHLDGPARQCAAARRPARARRPEYRVPGRGAAGREQAAGSAGGPAHAATRGALRVRTGPGSPAVPRAASPARRPPNRPRHLRARGVRQERARSAGAQAAVHRAPPRTGLPGGGLRAPGSARGHLARPPGVGPRGPHPEEGASPRPAGKRGDHRLPRRRAVRRRLAAGTAAANRQAEPESGSRPSCTATRWSASGSTPPAPGARRPFPATARRCTPAGWRSATRSTGGCSGSRRPCPRISPGCSPVCVADDAAWTSARRTRRRERASPSGRPYRVYTVGTTDSPGPQHVLRVLRRPRRRS